MLGAIGVESCVSRVVRCRREAMWQRALSESRRALLGLMLLTAVIAVPTVPGCAARQTKDQSSPIEPLVLVRTVSSENSETVALARLRVSLTQDPGGRVHADVEFRNISDAELTTSSSDIVSVYAGSKMLFPRVPSGGGFGGDPISPGETRRWTIDVLPPVGEQDIRVQAGNWFAPVPSGAAGQLKMRHIEVTTQLSGIPDVNGP